MYSVSIGDDFIIPELFAYDNLNDELEVIVTNNLDLNSIGTYIITYTATNEIGTTTLLITVNVVNHENLPTITLLDDIPETYFTKQKLIFPDATAIDYLGNELTAYKSADEIMVYNPGYFVVEYYAEDEFGNTRVIQFVIEFIENPEANTFPVELEEYYSSAIGLSGSNLKNELHNIISDMTLLAYNTTSVPLSIIDRDLNQTDKVYLIYNGSRVNYTWDQGKTWNKEHVWAKSLFGLSNMSSSHRGMGSDMHNLRAATPNVNSSRGNKIFVDGSGLYGARGSGWYPGDEHIGDVARIILYMHVAWNYEINVGSLDMFLRWHQLDPVDDFEKARNNKIFEYQENRNPFIDYPDFAVDIWGEVTINQGKVTITLYVIDEYIDFINRESLYLVV